LKLTRAASLFRPQLGKTLPYVGGLKLAHLGLLLKGIQTGYKEITRIIWKINTLKFYLRANESPNTHIFFYYKHLHVLYVLWLLYVLTTTAFCI
jgi:hypothetical protein